MEKFSHFTIQWRTVLHISSSTHYIQCWVSSTTYTAYSCIGFNGFTDNFANACIEFSYSRFQVKKKQFFHNFLTIMMFGVIGVFISSSIITAGNNRNLNSWSTFSVRIFLGAQWKKKKKGKAFKFKHFIVYLGSWWLFPSLGFVGLTARDYLGEFLFHFTQV